LNFLRKRKNQKAALTAWARQYGRLNILTVADVKSTPLQGADYAGESHAFSAGTDIVFKVNALRHFPFADAGEMLWYHREAKHSPTFVDELGDSQNRGAATAILR